MSDYIYYLKCILFTPQPTPLDCDFFSPRPFKPIDYGMPDQARHPKRSGRAKPTLVHVPPTPLQEPNDSRPRPSDSQPDVRLGPIQLNQDELGQGIVYLYKQKQQTKLESRTVLVLAVPSYLESVEFEREVGDKVCYVRDGWRNRYMVLIEFQEVMKAKRFHEKYNGRRFNMTQPEVSHVVFLKEHRLKTKEIESYPYLDTTSGEREIDWIELPTCPGCLERMDENTTGLKGHRCKVGCDCGQDRWGTGGCPTCDGVESGCVDCGSTEGWICMVCGHVGCGRYQAAHAYHHYRATGHAYALERATQDIWDYQHDGYVHRLAEREIESADPKSDQIALDYSYMLTSQLDSQRIYYEGKLEAVKEERKRLGLIGLERDVLDQREENGRLRKESDGLDLCLLELKKENERLDRRIANVKEKAELALKELNEEKLLTKSLIVNNQLLKKSFDKNDSTLKSLTEQVEELMGLLETKQK